MSWDEAAWWEPLARVREDLECEARMEAWDLLEIERSRVRLAQRVVPGTRLECRDGSVWVVQSVEEILHGALAVSCSGREVLLREEAISRAWGLAGRLADEGGDGRSYGSWLREHAGARVSVAVRGHRLVGVLDAVGADHVDLQERSGAVSVGLWDIDVVEVLDARAG